MVPFWMRCVFCVLCGAFGAFLVYQHRRMCATKARLQQLGRQAALSTDDLVQLTKPQTITIDTAALPRRRFDIFHVGWLPTLQATISALDSRGLLSIESGRVRLCILLQVPSYDVQQIQDELRRSSIEHFVTAGPIEEEATE